jgi:FkbM family methyltransferase
MLKALARRALPYLPTRVLSKVMASRPYLAKGVRREFVWSKHAGSLSVWINPANAIEMDMLSPDYDRDVAQAIARFVRPGATCLDVGANVGAVTLMLAEAVGGAGRVIAIEPGPPYRDRLAANLALNDGLASRVQIEPVGASDSPGTLTWEADPDAPFNAVLSPQGSWFHSGQGVQVPVKTIDQIVDRLDLPRVDFMKIDVESMELEVLRGAANTLRRCRPAVIFETMAWARNHRLPALDIFRAIPDLLAELGYATVTLKQGRLVAVDWNNPPPNTLAVPAG